MPNTDGYSATQMIRHFKNKQKASISILAMTANAFDEDKKMALQVGMNGHISKPIDAKSVKKAIMSMLLKYVSYDTFFYTKFMVCCIMKP